MSSTLDSLTYEVERIIGKPLSPVRLDKRLLVYKIPVAVFLFLVIFRPSFLYAYYNDKKRRSFSFTRLAVYTVVFTLCIASAYVYLKVMRV